MIYNYSEENKKNVEELRRLEKEQNKVIKLYEEKQKQARELVKELELKSFEEWEEKEKENFYEFQKELKEVKRQGEIFDSVLFQERKIDEVEKAVEKQKQEELNNFNVKMLNREMENKEKFENFKDLSKKEKLETIKERVMITKDKMTFNKDTTINVLKDRELELKEDIKTKDLNNQELVKATYKELEENKKKIQDNNRDYKDSFRDLKRTEDRHKEVSKNSKINVFNRDFKKLDKSQENFHKMELGKLELKKNNELEALKRFKETTKDKDTYKKMVKYTMTQYNKDKKQLMERQIKEKREVKMLRVVYPKKALEQLEVKKDKLNKEINKERDMGQFVKDMKVSNKMSKELNKVQKQLVMRDVKVDKIKVNEKVRNNVKKNIDKFNDKVLKTLEHPKQELDKKIQQEEQRRNQRGTGRQ